MSIFNHRRTGRLKDGGAFERKLERLTDDATEETQREIETAFRIRFGSPTQSLVAELGIYARHLQTWTCDAEEIGDVRPLRDLLNDAAMFITIHCNLASAVLPEPPEQPEVRD